jgi:hypothetical protein
LAGGAAVFSSVWQLILHSAKSPIAGAVLPRKHSTAIDIRCKLLGLLKPNVTIFLVIPIQKDWVEFFRSFQ